jgi:hypothetical protein
MWLSWKKTTVTEVMKMTAKQKLDLADTILAAVKTNLLDATTGELKPLPDLGGVSATIQAVMAALIAAGVTIPVEVQKAIDGLVAVLAIV